VMHDRQECESFCGWLLQCKSFLVSIAAFRQYSLLSGLFA